jgi:hypothetical protein
MLSGREPTGGYDMEREGSIKVETVRLNEYEAAMAQSMVVLQKAVTIAVDRRDRNTLHRMAAISGEIFNNALDEVDKPTN